MLQNALGIKFFSGLCLVDGNVSKDELSFELNAGFRLDLN